MRPGCCPWMGAGVGQERSSLRPGWGAWAVGELSLLPPAPGRLRHPKGGSRVGCQGPAGGPIQDLGWEVKSSSWAVLLEWWGSVSPAPKTGWARAEQRKNQELSDSIHGKLSKAR